LNTKMLTFITLGWLLQREGHFIW